MSKIRLSIIVAIYNVEDYIVECAESLLNCGADIEVIFIDDGSTDNSLIFLTEFLKKNINNNFKLIKQINMGISGVRNNGIKISNGEYLTFIDGDDLIIFPEMIKLFNRGYLNYSDIIIGNFLLFNELDNKKLFSSNYNLSKKNLKGINVLLNNFLLDMTPSVWKAIYKKSFVVLSDDEFLLGVPVAEDFHWFYKKLFQAENVYIDNVYYYMYRQRNGSAIRSQFTLDKYNGILKISNDLINFLLLNGKQLDKDVLSKLHEKIAAVLVRGVALYRGKQNLTVLKYIISNLKIKTVKISLVLMAINFFPNIVSKILYLKYKNK